ncbi:NAD(P)-binding family protein [Rhodococcus sp. MTM3W5.2]|nr:NAD(P)-binding family protein [Rhodococcus sp. MTM3W5.2]
MPAAAGDEPNYLVGLNLTDRRVVVVGGGTVAQRRLGLLVACGARVHVVSRAVTPAVEAMATGGQITIDLRAYADGDLDGAWYAIACTDEPDTNAAVVAEAERSRIFCVRADSARNGTAVTPRARPSTGSSSACWRAATTAARPRCAPRWSRPCSPAAWWTSPSRTRPASRWSAADPATRT